MTRPRVGALLAAATVAAVVAFAPDAARACQSCFGADDGPMIDGARAGGWALIALAAFMQVAFATFFLILRRRLRQAAASASTGER